jgi:hypothetical protein
VKVSNTIGVLDLDLLVVEECVFDTVSGDRLKVVSHIAKSDIAALRRKESTISQFDKDKRLIASLHRDRIVGQDLVRLSDAE